MEIQNWLESRMEGNNGMRESNNKLNKEGTNVEGVIDDDDPLMDFFIHCKLKKKDVIYKALQEHEIDYEELLEIEETQFNDVFVPIFPDGLARTRLFNALKTNPDSAIFKEKQKKKIVYVRVPISSEEEKALNVIKTSMNANQSQIDNLCHIRLPKLTEISKQNYGLIDSVFNEIIQCAMAQKDELKHFVKRKTHDQQQQIQSQINDLNEQQKQLTQWYEQSQSLVQDMSLDASDRKLKIMSLCKNVLTATATISGTIMDDMGSIQKQDTQLDAIKDKLREVILIEDDEMNEQDVEECKEESQSPSVSDNTSIKSEEVQQTKAQKRKKRRSKNKRKMVKEPFLTVAKGEQKASESPIPPAITPSGGSIVVQDTYNAIKEADKRLIVDSWEDRDPEEYPMDESVKKAWHGYKKHLCVFYKKYNGYCRDGDNCQFAHGMKELKKYNPLAKTTMCEWVMRKQTCPHMAKYGCCSWKHPKDKKKIVKK